MKDRTEAEKNPQAAALPEPPEHRALRSPRLRRLDSFMDARRRHMFARARRIVETTVAIGLLLLFSALPARAITTVTGIVYSAQGVTISTNIIFRRITGPGRFGPGSGTGGMTNVLSSTNGAFACDLIPGDYRVTFQTRPEDTFLISVTNINGSINIEDVRTTTTQYNYPQSSTVQYRNERGVPNGYPYLDATGLIPTSNVPAQIIVTTGSTEFGPRRKLNLIGSSMTVGYSTNNANDIIEVTLAPYANFSSNGVHRTGRDRLNFIPGANTTISVVDNPGLPAADITISSTASGGATNFTGDVTGSGTGSVGLTLAQDRVRKAGDSMTGALTVNPGTVTVNTPSLTASQTWNGAGSFEAITASITDTASASGSYPIIARVGGSSVFYARKDGLIFGSASGQFGGSTVNATSLQLSADGFVGRLGGTSGGNTAYGTTYLWTRSPGNLEFTVDSDNSDTTQTIRFARDSGTLGGGTTMTEWTQAGEFRFQNGSGSALLKVFSAFTDTLNGAWLGLDAQGASGRLRLGSEFNGTGTALPLDFRHGFGTAATLQTNGTFNFATIGVTNSVSTPELRSGNGTVLATLDNAGEMQIPSLQITNSVDSTSESLSGTSPAANWATQGIKTITLSGNTTFTFSNTPTGNGYVRSLAVKVLGNGSHTIAFPGTVDWQTSTIGTPRASDWTDYLFEYRDGTVYGYASDGGGLDADLTAVGNITGTGLIARAGDANWTNITTSAGVAAHITDETGTGAIVLATSPTITTPTISGAITFPDGVRQTFNPDGTAAGLNVGSQAGDPSSPTNGDLWYDSTANELTARINGANVALGAGGGSATYKPWDTNQYHLPSTTYHVGTATSVPVNTMRCIAFFSEAGGKLTNISFSVTTGGSAGSVARIGVYNATSANDRRPGTLVVGSGEIDTTTTGHKVATVDVTLDPQKWYLLAILTGTAAPTLASSDPAAAYTMGFDPVNNGPVTYYQVTQTYGALPANAPTGGTMVVSAAQPKMFVKFSQSP